MSPSSDYEIDNAYANGFTDGALAHRRTTDEIRDLLDEALGEATRLADENERLRRQLAGTVEDGE